MHIREAQTRLPKWHVDRFDHAVTHAQKALGRLAGMVDDADHARELAGGIITNDDFEAPPAEVAKFAADLVVCALKLAQTCPSGTFDLEEAVLARIREKNPPGSF